MSCCTTDENLQHSYESPKVNVSQEERFMSLFGAGALVTVGLLRASPAFLLLGAGLAFRGVTGHCMLYEATGLNTNTLQEPARQRIAY